MNSSEKINLRISQNLKKMNFNTNFIKISYKFRKFAYFEVFPFLIIWRIFSQFLFD